MLIMETDQNESSSGACQTVHFLTLQFIYFYAHLFTNPYPDEHDNPYLCKQYRPRSDGLKKSSDQDLHYLPCSLRIEWIHYIK